MRPPPWIIRRILLIPLAVLLAGIFIVILAPLWLIGTAILLVAPRSEVRYMRISIFIWLYSVLEVCGLLAAFTVWVATGAGWFSRGFERANYAIVRICLTVLLWGARRLFRLHIHDDVLPSDVDERVPLIVASRHAGPGDSFLLYYEIMGRLHRRPKVILKSSLRWDPLVDVLLSRTGCVFIEPAESAQRVADNIRAMAASLDSEHALLIFPEGGNFTARRRAHVIEQFRQKGREEQAIRAENLLRLLAPQMTGFYAAISGAPHAQVALVAHTGLDALNTFGDVWQETPIDKTLLIAWHVFSADEVPHQREQLAEWLNYQWQLMDMWVLMKNSQDPSPQVD